MFKNNKSLSIGWILVIFLSFFPVFLWFLSPSFSPRFSTFNIIMSNLGQLFGLIGAAMFALNLILSARFKFIEKLFVGLDNVYYHHSFLGQLAFILLIFHPLMLIPKYAAGTFYGAAEFLLPNNGLAINLGWYSLIGMIVLIVGTIFLSLKYNIWKISHKFFGIFFFLASLHIYFIPSDVSNYLPLRIYMLTLSFLAISVYIYYSLLNKLFVKKFNYIVKNVSLLKDNVINVVMRTEGERMSYNPGQFIFVSFDSKEVENESHPFSITSNPNEEDLSITVKKLGDFTKNLELLQIGTSVKIEGPYGSFSCLAVNNKKQIWIAGGIGITPFISMAKSLKLEDKYYIDLFYCLKNESEAVFLGELMNISSSLGGGLKIVPFYSDSMGHINSDFIEQESNGILDKDIFICAPVAMIRSLRIQLLKKGIKGRNLHSEEFSF